MSHESLHIYSPLLIHNVGRGTREEDRLFAWPITGHYRWAV